MTEAIVSTVVQTLGGLLVEEFNLLSGVTDQVQEVSRELKRMQCFLRDADTRDYKDETIHNWLREIKSLTYRVEDIVEMFAVEVASKRKKGVKKALKRFACIFCEGRSLHKLGLEILSVKNDISNLTLSLQSYDDIRAINEGGTSGGATEENGKWTKQTYAHEVEEYFVGMEEDMRKLVPLVVDEQKHLPIISVWGMGGLGKTTIARKIYHHRDVRRCFQLFAWVCITQQGQTRVILRDILMQFFPEKKGEIKRMEDRELVEQLYQVQIENKCLVVLDDIWYMRDWENLVHAFPILQGAGSKLLLTTRMKEVAEVGIPHELRCLNDKESWELLKIIAFSRKNVQDMKIEPKLEAVGFEMACKCGGLPLAICVLGGILKDMDSLKDWQIVNKNIDSYLSTGKGSEEGSGGGGAVARVLSLSYNALPYHLKPCFLYLGNFQEDEVIDAEQLYLLWIAGGMVSSQHQRSGETLMDVAERYLNELGKRSMVQVHANEFSMYTRFDSCRLHDMMRDFCLKKGREEEFLRVIDLQGVKKSWLHSFSSTNNAAYRLVIHADSNLEDPIKAISVLEDYRQIRSLIVHNNYDFQLGKTTIVWFKWIKFICENFRLLRVLKFERYDFGEKKMPKGVEKLIHLRLLSFRDCNLVGIPSSIAKLPFLETLDLGGINRIKMPNVLREMKRLRHLYLDGTYQLEKVRFSGLNELETLDGFQSESHEVGDLHELTNLRSLKASVTDNGSTSAVINYIRNNAPNLQETVLCFQDSVSFSSEEGSFLLRKIFECRNIHHLMIFVKIGKFPRYEEHFLLALVGLALEGTEIDEDPMETLQKLPQLRYLELGDESYLGTDLICHELGFPQLRDLKLSGLPNLRSWKVENGGMPSLSNLAIFDCSKLEMIPEGLKDVTGLKELVLKDMPPTFVDRISVRDGREGEDFYKIKHVPSITIRC